MQELPGVTRDRKSFEAEWQGTEFTVVDTGGWLPGGSTLDEKVSAQSERAVRDADAVILVVDATVGVTEDDASVADWLRRAKRPVLLVANKVDSEARRSDIWAFVSLGLGEPFAVTALHGLGTGDLLDELVKLFPAIEPVEEEEVVEGPAIPGVAIVGRPNVGKSTLFNRLIGDERAVVHDMPGTTRDAIDTVVETDEGPIRFIDTAGMRRRSKVDDGTEYYSVVRALRAVDDADIALLVIDATEGVTHQDQRLAERVDAVGLPDRRAAEQVGAPRHRAAARHRSPGRGSAPLHRQLDGAAHQREEWEGPPQAAARARPRDRGLPPARADTRGEQGHPGRAVGAARARRSASALRDAGRGRSADVHAVRQPRAAAHLPAVPRADACEMTSTSAARR